MSGLFGSSLPMLLVALVVVVAAALGAIYLVRRFGIGARPGGVAHSRQSRLALVDSVPIIDGRKLVIVRRDNVEHLLLIGGATDVLVEPNIARSAVHPSAPPIRDVPPTRAAEPEPHLRAAAQEPAARVTPSAAQELPLADGANWPLQPEPSQRAKRASEDASHWPEPALRSVATESPMPQPVSFPERSTEPVRPVAQEATQVSASDQEKEKPAMPTDHFAELAAALQRPAAQEPKPVPGRAGASTPTEDAHLTDMANRLEAALRRPLSQPVPTPPQSRVEPRRPVQTPSAAPPTQRITPTIEVPRVPSRLASEPRIAPEPRVTPEPRVAPEPTVNSSSDEERPAFESLEREMASLLGRPPR